MVAFQAYRALKLVVVELGGRRTRRLSVLGALVVVVVVVGVVEAVEAVELLEGLMSWSWMMVSEEVLVGLE